MVNTIRCKTTCIDKFTNQDVTFTVLKDTLVCQTQLKPVHTCIKVLKKTRICYKRLTSVCLNYQSLTHAPRCVDKFTSVKTTVGCVEPKCVPKRTVKCK